MHIWEYLYPYISVKSFSVYKISKVNNVFSEFWRQHYILDSGVDVQNFKVILILHVCMLVIRSPLCYQGSEISQYVLYFSPMVLATWWALSLWDIIFHSCEISGNSYYWDNQWHLQIHSNFLFFFFFSFGITSKVFFQTPCWVLYFCYVIFTCSVPFHRNFIFFIVSFSPITVAILPLARLTVLIIINF